MLRAGVFTVLLINFLTFYLKKTYLLKTMNFNNFYDASASSLIAFCITVTVSFFGIKLLIEFGHNGLCQDK